MCSSFSFFFFFPLLGFGYRFLLIASRFLYKHAASSQFVILLDDNTIMMECHLRYLSKMFVLMNNEVMLEKISETVRLFYIEFLLLKKKIKIIYPKECF